MDHDHGGTSAPEVKVMDRSAQVCDLMPQCVMESYARIPPAKRISISATAGALRRPSWCSPSKVGKEPRVASTSWASRNEQPGLRASAEASLSASALATPLSSFEPRWRYSAGFKAQRAQCDDRYSCTASRGSPATDGGAPESGASAAIRRCLEPKRL